MQTPRSVKKLWLEEDSFLTADLLYEVFGLIQPITSSSDIAKPLVMSNKPWCNHTLMQVWKLFVRVERKKRKGNRTEQLATRPFKTSHKDFWEWGTEVFNPFLSILHNHVNYWAEIAARSQLDSELHLWNFKAYSASPQCCRPLLFVGLHRNSVLKPLTPNDLESITRTWTHVIASHSVPRVHKKKASTLFFNLQEENFCQSPPLIGMLFLLQHFWAMVKKTQAHARSLPSSQRTHWAQSRKLHGPLYPPLQKWRIF